MEGSISLLQFFAQISAPYRGGYRAANRQYLETLPIRRVESADTRGRALRDRLVGLVGERLALEQRLSPLRAVVSNEREDLLRSIQRLEDAIDGVVYELYGLTDADRRLVEGGS